MGPVAPQKKLTKIFNWANTGRVCAELGRWGNAQAIKLLKFGKR
jgi:hypothetical protein